MQPIAYGPGGPATVPRGDLAALVNGKYVFDAVGMKVAADAIRRVTGERMCMASRV